MFLNYSAPTLALDPDNPEYGNIHQSLLGNPSYGLNVEGNFYVFEYTVQAGDLSGNAHLVPVADYANFAMGIDQLTLVQKHSVKTFQNILGEAASVISIEDGPNVCPLKTYRWEPELDLSDVPMGEYVLVLEVTVPGNSQDLVATQMASFLPSGSQDFIDRSLMLDPRGGSNVANLPISKTAGGVRLRITNDTFGVVDIDSEEILLGESGADDGDLLPDTWEIARYGSTAYSDGTFDSDRDQAHDLIDFLNGEDAFDAVSDRFRPFVESPYGEISFTHKFQLGGWFSTQTSELKWHLEYKAIAEPISPNSLIDHQRERYVAKVSTSINPTPLLECDLETYLANRGAGGWLDDIHIESVASNVSQKFTVEWGEVIPDWDQDGDGLTNLEEILGNTDPENPDSDFDGIPDDLELPEKVRDP